MVLEITEQEAGFLLEAVEFFIEADTALRGNRSWQTQSRKIFGGLKTKLQKLLGL